MATDLDFNYLLTSFGLKGDIVRSEINNNGHINSTYMITLKNDDGSESVYTIQKINTYVFKDPDKLMNNIIGITSHLYKKAKDINSSGERDTLKFLPAVDGKYYCIDKNGDCWRCYKYIDNVYTCNTIDNTQVFYNAGKAFGNFQKLLSDYPIETLFETIPNFHNTYSRFLDFKKAVKDNLSARAATVENEIQFILDRENDTKVLIDMLDKKELPVRVTHNDTKLNNILFDNETNEGICIIDLDTVMPGLSLYDFGDSIRFGANTASEDEKDVSKVSLDLDLYQSYVEGYLSSAKESLTKNEIEYLPFSAKLMTFECGMRFLTDYLNGDVYFKTEYPEHNLVRCRTQLALVKDIEDKFDKMKQITKTAEGK